jgi:site-specific DNA recombinase
MLTALGKNRSLALHPGRFYLLRGLVRCGICGKNYVGTQRGSGSTPGWRAAYYRCGSQLGAVHPDPATRCHGAEVRAERIEDIFWQDCRYFIEHPDDALGDPQEQLRARLAQTSGGEGERRRLVALLRDKDAARDRVMTLFRRRRSSLDDVERQLDEIARESGELRAMVDTIDAQVELAKAWESRITDAAVMLARFREHVDEIEATNDVDGKRQVFDLFVQSITVQTEGNGRRKKPEITVRYVFGAPIRPVDSSTDSRGYSRDTD